MNTAMTFLYENRERLNLDRFGLDGRASTVMITPRFRASRHVVFLVLSGRRPRPVLVVKTPRIATDHWGVQREAAILRAVEAWHVGGSGSVPRVIDCRPYRGHWMLVETALTGRPMDPATVRRRPAECCETVVRWLAGLRRPAGHTDAEDTVRFSRLIERPLDRFEGMLSLSAKESQLIESTREVVSPLGRANLPLAFEHGDLSHPNLISLPDGRAGVIDWELAELRGFPASDLFFFLTYVAFARAKAQGNDRYAAAFHAAFFGRKAWARRYVSAYAREHHLAAEMLTPLFVACWARRVTGLPDRLGVGAAAGLGSETSAWLRANRYYALWNHTLKHLDELHWDDLPYANRRGT